MRTYAHPHRLAEHRLLYDQANAAETLQTVQEPPDAEQQAPATPEIAGEAQIVAERKRTETQEQAEVLSRQAEQAQRALQQLRQRTGQGESGTTVEGGKEQGKRQHLDPPKLQRVELPPVESGTGAAGMAGLVLLLGTLLGKLRDRQAREEGRQEQPRGSDRHPSDTAPPGAGQGSEVKEGKERTSLQSFLQAPKRGTEVLGARNVDVTNREALTSYVRDELQRKEGRDLGLLAYSLSPEQAYAFANDFVMDRMSGTVEDQLIEGVSWQEQGGQRLITITLNDRFDDPLARQVRSEGQFTFTQGSPTENGAETLYNRLRSRDEMPVDQLLREGKGVCRHYAECVAAVFQVVREAQPEKFANVHVRHTDTIAAWNLLRNHSDSEVRNATEVLNKLGHHAFTTLYVLDAGGKPQMLSFDAAGLDVETRDPGKPLSVSHDNASVWSIFAFVEMEEAGVISSAERKAKIQAWIDSKPAKPANLNGEDWERFHTVAEALASA